MLKNNRDIAIDVLNNLSSKIIQHAVEEEEAGLSDKGFMTALVGEDTVYYNCVTGAENSQCVKRMLGNYVIF